MKLDVHFKMLFRFVTLTHVLFYIAAVRALRVVSDAERLRFAEPNSVPGGEPLFRLPSCTSFDRF